jgi:ribonuclease III
LTDAGSTPAIIAFADRLGLAGFDPESLVPALRHRSWTAENPGHDSNERLEFLGDAVLDLVVTDHLYAILPDEPEGQLAKIRAAVVSEVALSAAAAEVGLGRALLVGRGEDLSGGREKPSLLSDAFEAVLGAVYLALGYDSVRELVLRLLGPAIEAASVEPGEADFKTRLQEYAATLDLVPRYEIRDDGPDHAKTFYASVEINGQVTGAGEGRSKKHAEQAAARDAWTRLPAERE